VRVLLAHRPNLALRNINGESALQIANNVDIMWLLIQAGAPLDDADEGTLCRVAATCTAAIHVLVNHNIVMSDLHDYFGQTPLHVATRTCADLAC
jgi:ankyrin repeat protein